MSDIWFDDDGEVLYAQNVDGEMVIVDSELSAVVFSGVKC